MSVVRSSTFARLGMTSVSFTPVIFVSIVANSPRMSSGASGLGSQMSR
jgi:hypothetical protein